MRGILQKIFLYAIALLLAVLASALLHQGANDSSVEDVNTMGLGGPLDDTRLSISASNGNDWLTRPYAVRHGVLMERSWAGLVSAVEGKNAFIGGGSQHGLAVGMLLDVQVSGKRLLDPESGLTMGSVKEKIGRLIIVDVEKLVSKAAIVEGCADLEPGAQVELRP